MIKLFGRDSGGGWRSHNVYIVHIVHGHISCMFGTLRHNPNRWRVWLLEGDTDTISSSFRQNGLKTQIRMVNSDIPYLYFWFRTWLNYRLMLASGENLACWSRLRWGIDPIPPMRIFKFMKFWNWHLFIITFNYLHGPFGLYVKSSTFSYRYVWLLILKVIYTGQLARCTPWHLAYMSTNFI